MRQPLTDSRPVYLFCVSSCTQNVPDETGDADSQTEKQDSDGMHQQPAEDADESVECDDQLLEWSDQATNVILPVGDPTEQAMELGRFVANCLGGEVNRDEFTSYRWELGIAEVRHEINSNVIPIGKIKLGGQLHRALLFKFLADRIGLPTNLTRGEYGRSYNEILLQNVSSSEDIYSASP
ncbi:unnamed protein product [Dicrocoelium dendriticum]|nr:unnamed protein product [Dicrocoelium dendriticum]